MSLHSSNESNFQQSKKLLGQATIVNGLLGLGEFVVGGFTGSNLLQADAIHNTVDTSMYGMKWKLTGNDNKEKVSKYRKMIMQVICLGSLAIGVKSGVEILNEEYHKTPPAVVGVAIVAGISNTVVAKRLHDTLQGSEGVHHDGLRHATSDALGSIVTVSCAALAYKGLEVADPVGAIITSGATIAMNYPTKQRMNV